MQTESWHSSYRPSLGSPGVCKRGSAPPSQPEVLRSFLKSPKTCPSSSRCACSSPGLAHTPSPQTPKCPPLGLCLSLLFLCSAQAAQERTQPVHSDLQQPRALGDSVRSPRDLATHTPILSGQQVAGGPHAWQLLPSPVSPVPYAPFGHRAGTPTKPVAGGVLPPWPGGCVANSAASPSSSGPPSSPAFWRSSAAPLPGPCWSTTPGEVRGAGQQRAPRREPHGPQTHRTLEPGGGGARPSHRWGRGGGH